MALQKVDRHGCSVSGETLTRWAQAVVELQSRRVALSIWTHQLINYKTRQPVFRWLLKVKLRSNVARAWCWERKQRCGCVYIFPCDRLVEIPLQTSPCGPLICLESWGHDVKYSMTHLCIVFTFNEDTLCCTVHCPHAMHSPKKGWGPDKTSICHIQFPPIRLQRGWGFLLASKCEITVTTCMNVAKHFYTAKNKNANLFSIRMACSRFLYFLLHSTSL